MASSGNSGTPLVQKLGIKTEMKVLLVNAPAEYFDLQEGISVETLNNMID